MVVVQLKINSTLLLMLVIIIIIIVIRIVIVIIISHVYRIQYKTIPVTLCPQQQGLLLCRPLYVIIVMV